MSETIITKDLLDKMVRLRNQAEYFALVGVELLREMTVTEMAQVCNGMGAKWMPEEVREALDRLCPDLLAPSAVHDAMYAFLPDGREAFLWSNKSFKENGYRMAEGLHKGFGGTIARWRTKAEARAFRRLCDRFGAYAWTQAKEDAMEMFDLQRLTHLQKVAQEIWEKHK